MRFRRALDRENVTEALSAASELYVEPVELETPVNYLLHPAGK
jgi:hypothetical protein